MIQDKSSHILDYVAAHPKCSTDQILRELHLSHRHRETIRTLASEGKLVDKGSGNGRHWNVVPAGYQDQFSECTADQLHQIGELNQTVKSSQLVKHSFLLYNPVVQQGPSDHPHIPEGHELGGVSTLTGPSGELKEQWNKTRVAGTEPAQLPYGFDQPRRISRMARGDGSTVVEWRSYNREEADRNRAFLDAIRSHVAEHVRPLDPLPTPAWCDSDLLTAYCLGDPHIGMLAWGEEVGENFDVQIATRELIQCVRNLTSRAPASELAVVANLGDFLHAQDDKQLTPGSGNKLDVDGRFARTARLGIDMFVCLIESALQKHNHVIVRNISGNHDQSACFWITETIRREFKNEPRITVQDSFNPYQYDQFGQVMLMWAHTDGVKLEKLAAIAAADEPTMWGSTRYRYAHGGHIHSKHVIELPGMVAESHRTLAGKDAWTHRGGYRAGRSLQAITYHREWGEDSRVIEGVERVRAALVQNGVVE